MRVKKLALALDVPSLRQARSLVDELASHVDVFKVGLELFTAAGPEAVHAVHAVGAECFLDLKLLDIPQTMARAAAAAAELGVRYLTVHAAAGPRALGQTQQAVEGSITKLLGVSVLTSFDRQELASVGVEGSVGTQVHRLASLAHDHDLAGFVCSPHECAVLRSRFGASPILAVPGIRPTGSAAGDQRRIATPEEALQQGADMLVVGRPIREAKSPITAARQIREVLLRHDQNL